MGCGQFQQTPRYESGYFLSVPLNDEEQQCSAEDEHERRQDDELGLQIVSSPLEALLPYVVPDEEAYAAENDEQHDGYAHERVVRIRHQRRERLFHTHKVEAGVAEGGDGVEDGVPQPAPKPERT